MSASDWTFQIRQLRNTPVGYALSAAILLIALLLRAAVDGWVTIPFVTLFPATILGGLIGGRLAGIALAAIGGIISWYLWLPPTRSFTLEWPSGWFNAAFYVLTSAVLLYLVRRFNEALDAVERERDRADELFSELQHRTANNMQSAAAMIQHGIRRVRAEPDTAVEVLTSAQRRFEIMGRVHRRLYDGSVKKHDVKERLQAVCGDLVEGLGVDNVKIEVVGEQIELRQSPMLTLSLLISELLLNSIKHGFRDGRAGRVTISVEESGADVCIVYQDDGIGPSQPAPTPASGLGARILRSLAAQLSGRVERRPSDCGYCCTVTFPRPDGKR